MSRDAEKIEDRWRCSRRSLLRIAALGGACALVPSALAFVSPLDQPATFSELTARSPLMDVAYTGRRIVAVGLRGGIVYSDDQGQSWKQAAVPVSTDLVAVCFVSSDKGWAVGHGGVVLHSVDGGQTWNKQLDGFQASRLAVEFYQSRVGTLADAERLLERERLLAVEGETQPFLDVYFEDELHGYAVGTFNRIFLTEDGGTSWMPQMHLTDNPSELHFYAVHGYGGQLYLAGEQGNVWRREEGRFVDAKTPYDGTLFGVLAGREQDLVVAYGMRGSLYLSRDRGNTWSKVVSHAQGAITAALMLADGSLLIADQLGGLAISTDWGGSFRTLPVSRPMPFFGGTVVSERTVALVGAKGVQIETI